MSTSLPTRAYPTDVEEVSLRNCRDEREKIPPKYKIEFERCRYKVLKCLTNLRAYEFSGTTLQTGITIVPPSEDTDVDSWAHVHRTTLEDILLVSAQYYRRIYPKAKLQDAFQRILGETDSLPPFRPTECTPEEVHKATEGDYKPGAIDMRALEQQSVDMLVTQIYREAQFHTNQTAFMRFVPTLCEYYRTPLFDSSADAFYTLVVHTFEDHPARGRLDWESTDDIFTASLPATLLSYP